MATSLTDEKLKALAAAIFQQAEPTVVETYSAFGTELRSFHSPEELVGYAHAQRESSSGSAHLALHYPDMGGTLLRLELQLDPAKCQGHTYRYSAAGWGLIWVHLQWRPGPADSFISANSEKRAIAWAQNAPELGPPQEWNWPAIGRHLRRLRRVFKLS